MNRTTLNQSTFWNTLSSPIIGLSPMDGVSDHPFRHIQKKYGDPALIYTEFTRVEALCLGRDRRALRPFLYDESQRPIIAQIYGCEPDYFRQVAILACELGFDGIDINMGCPSKAVAFAGAGAALINEPHLAQQIIAATKRGIQQWQNGATVRDCPDVADAIADEVAKRHAHLPLLYRKRRAIPVSVKTRIGFDAVVVEEWIPRLLETEPAAIALHGRTLLQRYRGAADWEQIERAAELTALTKTLLLGNGDLRNHADALDHIRRYRVDGALIGRACRGNPFVFDSHRSFSGEGVIAKMDHLPYLSLALEHARLFHKTFSGYERYNFLPMRKHLGWYARNTVGGTELRQKLQRCNTLADAEILIHEWWADQRSIDPAWEKLSRHSQGKESARLTASMA